MPRSSNLSLVLPPELSGAFALLSNTFFCLRGADGSRSCGFDGSTANVLSHLVQKGLEAYAPILDAAIAAQERDVAAYAELVAYLMQRPGTPGVTSADFPENSAAHALLQGIEAADSEFDEPMDEPRQRPWTLTWDEAVRELGWRETQLENVAAARAALGEAMRSQPWLRVAADH